jgi:hypothetical protein
MDGRPVVADLAEVPGAGHAAAGTRTSFVSTDAGLGAQIDCDHALVRTWALRVRDRRRRTRCDPLQELTSRRVVQDDVVQGDDVYTGSASGASLGRGQLAPRARRAMPCHSGSAATGSVADPYKYCCPRRDDRNYERGFASASPSTPRRLVNRTPDSATPLETGRWPGRTAVARAVHLAHAARSDPVGDVVRAEAGAAGRDTGAG